MTDSKEITQEIAYEDQHPEEAIDNIGAEFLKDEGAILEDLIKSIPETDNKWTKVNILRINTRYSIV